MSQLLVAFLSFSESAFLTFRVSRASLIFILLTPLSALGFHHLMIGRYKQFILYCMTLSLFGLGWLFDWLMIDVYHREFMEDVSSGRLKGAPNDLMYQWKRLVDAFREVSSHYQSSNLSINHIVRPIHRPALDPQIRKSLSKHASNRESSGKSIHDLLATNRSTSQSTNHVRFAAEPFDLQTVTPSPKVTLRSEELASPIEQATGPSKIHQPTQSIDENHPTRQSSQILVSKSARKPSDDSTQTTANDSTNPQLNAQPNAQPIKPIDQDVSSTAASSTNESSDQLINQSVNQPIDAGEQSIKSASTQPSPVSQKKGKNKRKNRNT